MIRVYTDCEGRVLSEGGMTNRLAEFVGCAIEEEAERARWDGVYTWLRSHIWMI